MTDDRTQEELRAEDEALRDVVSKSAARFSSYIQLGHALDDLHEKLGFPVGVNPLCGWDWCLKHVDDLKDWKPTIELIDGNSHHKLSGTPKQMREAIKVYVGGRH